MEQLQDVVAEEWAVTSTDLLVKLAHSMPKRCKLVIEARRSYQLLKPYVKGLLSMVVQYGKNQRKVDITTCMAGTAARK
jgi:hypothetical protein